MKTEADYQSLVKELKAIEARHFDLYLTDELIDMQNVLTDGRRETDEDYWSRMYGAAIDAAGFRAEDAGLDINKEIGRVIY